MKGKTRGQMQKGKPGRKNLERETREGKLLRKGKPEREKGLLRLLRAKTGYSSSVLIDGSCRWRDFDEDGHVHSPQTTDVNISNSQPSRVSGLGGVVSQRQ